MRLFGKKKEEDLNEPSVKTLKDLKPENKRRRKEPPKPWGRFERILIIVFLGGSVLTSGFLALKARAWRLPGMPRVTDLAGEGKIIIEKKDPNKSPDIDNLINEFKALTADLSGIYGFKVIRLQDGSYGLYDNEIFTAASLIKLPVLLSLYKEAEIGNIDLDSEHAITADDKAPGSGSLYSKPVGTKVKLRDLARLMGKESDNTAYRAVKSIIGNDKIVSNINEWGMTKTSLAENDTSPTDIAILFEKLWRGEIVSKKLRDEILSYLTNTIYEDRLPAGIPMDVTVSHKVGTEVGALSDGGIVFSDKPYIVVIMTKGVIESEASEIFPSLSKLIYEFEESH